MPRRSNTPWTKRSSCTATKGRLHHETSADSVAAPNAVAATSVATLVSAQRTRPTLCVHARRWVPCSSSRAIRGAPQNTPTSAGSKQEERDRELQPRVPGGEGRVSGMAVRTCTRQTAGQAGAPNRGRDPEAGRKEEG